MQYNSPESLTISKSVILSSETTINNIFPRFKEELGEQWNDLFFNHENRK